MSNTILITTGIIIILGMTAELATIAEDTSTKALGFSNDMNNALDCAFDARPLEECSPNLGSADFKQDATGLITKVEEIEDDLNELADNINKRNYEQSIEETEDLQVITA